MVGSREIRYSSKSLIRVGEVGYEECQHQDPFGFALWDLEPVEVMFVAPDLVVQPFQVLELVLKYTIIGRDDHQATHIYPHIEVRL